MMQGSNDNDGDKDDETLDEEVIDVAIVGASFGGLALANYLHQHNNNNLKNEQVKTTNSANHHHDRVSYRCYESRNYEPQFVATLRLPSLYMVLNSIGLNAKELDQPFSDRHGTDDDDGRTRVSRQALLQLLSQRVPVVTNVAVQQILPVRRKTKQSKNGGQQPQEGKDQQFDCCYMLKDQNGQAHGPFAKVVACNGVHSPFRTWSSDDDDKQRHDQNILLLGDAQWAADRWYDFGFQRVQRGADIALCDAVTLGAWFVQEKERTSAPRSSSSSQSPQVVSSSTISRFSAVRKRRQILFRRLLLPVLLPLWIAFLYHLRLWLRYEPST